MRLPIAWQQRNVPLTFTSITWSNEASGYVSSGPTLRPRVGRNHGETDGPEALGVVDVVADVGGLCEAYTRRTGGVPQDRQLVGDALAAVDLQLLRTRADDRALLHRNHQRAHADLLEPP